MVSGTGAVQEPDGAPEQGTVPAGSENGRNYSLRKNDADWNGSGKVDADDKMFDEEEVLMSREDLVGTFPKAPVSGINGTPANLVPDFDETKEYAVGDIVRVKVGEDVCTTGNSVTWPLPRS